MFLDIQKRSRKAGLPPETLIYTGAKKTEAPNVQLFSYNATQFQEASGATLDECLPKKISDGVTWINLDGLQNVDLVKQIGQHFNIHPLVLEDILSTDQRPKIEEFDDYVFMVLKRVMWHEDKKIFSIDQVSIVFGSNFLLSFQEDKNPLFTVIEDRLRKGQGHLRDRGSDYLAYILLDTVVDQFFVVLDNMGDQIELIEENIMQNPAPQTARTLYRLKRKMLMFRKAIWPVRELVSHLMQVNSKLVTPFVMPYIRDVYDHAMQVLDTTETFRDMLGGMLDIYLSSLANRTNDVMKVLTIIATIFIPLTFIASIYGMNFVYMPELHTKWGYPAVLCLMAVVAVIMLRYFRKKKWL